VQTSAPLTLAKTDPGTNAHGAQSLTFVTGFDCQKGIRRTRVRIWAPLWHSLSDLGLVALFFLLHLFLDGHVLKLTGFKHIAAFEALHELRVLLATHDSYARMLTSQGSGPF